MSTKIATEKAKNEIVIRPLAGGDSLIELTKVINLAYSSLGALAHLFEGARQSVERTAQRISQGSCLVAVVEDTVVGTICARAGFKNSVCAYLERSDILCRYQHAVHPSFQGLGIGHALVVATEELARAMYFEEVVAFTAEQNLKKREYWRRNGILEVDRIQWPGDSHFSVVGAKRLK